MADLAPDRAALVDRWYALGIYTQETIGELVATGGGAGDLVFTSDDSVIELATSALLDRARQIAGGLRAQGVGPGDVVAVQVASSADAFAVMGAVWLVGAVVLPVVDSHGPDELGFVLADSGAVALVTHTGWRGRSGVADAAATGFDGVVVAVGDDVPDGVVPLSALAVPTAARAADPVGADDVAVIVYTSGTTSRPKGVQHSHNTLLAGFRGTSGSGAGLVTLATFPAGHIAGTLGALRALTGSGRTVVMDRWSATRAATLIEEYGVVSSAGTPFYLQGLLDAAVRDNRDISSLKVFLTGAAPVPPALLRRAAARGIVSWRSYGSTEHPSISSATPVDDEETRHFTDGHVAADVEIRFIDDRDTDVLDGHEGEIVVRGPKLFVGYRDPPADEGAFLAGGWFRTGDIGRMDGRGRLVITDRKKDIIIRGGENISSKQVEDVLAAHPAVTEVAVCAEPDQTFGETVAAFVRLAEGFTLDLADVEAHFRDLGIPSHKVPATLRLVDDLPRTAAGKVLKSKLRERLATPDEFS